MLTKVKKIIAINCLAALSLGISVQAQEVQSDHWAGTDALDVAPEERRHYRYGKKHYRYCASIPGSNERLRPSGMGRRKTGVFLLGTTAIRLLQDNRYLGT